MKLGRGRETFCWKCLCLNKPSTIFILLFNIKLLTTVLIVILMRIYFMLIRVLNAKRKLERKKERSHSIRPMGQFSKVAS